jgi:predicted short-subunit dehydrogenase-like oxidoreductase (DUF2520 family)
MQSTLAIIGAGRVGRALGRQLHESGWKIGAVVTRTEASARRSVRFIGAGKPVAGMSRRILNTDLILITTPDDAIAEMVAELARVGGQELRGKIVLHTSGALDSSVLNSARERGASVGSMHPLQTFSGVGVPDLTGKIFAIEGDALAVRVARKISRALGAAPVQIEAHAKPRYHAAGTMAAGHVLAVMEAAAQLQMSTGMKRREALKGLLPLTRQVLDNYERLGPKAAWTGPLSRGDYGVVSAHLEALQQFSPEYRDAYEALNRLALYVLGQTSPVLPEKFQEVLQNRKAKAIGGK